MDLKTEGQKPTTTPKMHFTNKQPVTELVELKFSLSRKLIVQSVASIHSLSDGGSVLGEFSYHGDMFSILFR